MADQDNKKSAPPEEGNPAPALGETSVPEAEKEEEMVPLSQDTQAVLKEFDEAGLQVQDMPESNELQERRRKTKNRLRELAEVDDEEDAGDGTDTFENEEGGLADLLREANLTPKHLGFCLGAVLFLILLAGLIYGGIKAWGSLDFSGFDWGTETTEDAGTTTPDTNLGEGSPENHSSPDYTITAGLLVGGETSVDGSTLTGEDLGTVAVSEDELAHMIDDFGKLYEAMKVDVNELLDQSSDRFEALADYEQELHYLSYVGQQNQEQLQKESDALLEQFDHMEDLKAEQETRFFDKMSHLDPYASTAALNAYVSYGQEQVNLRAYYQARQKLLSYYDQVMDLVSARIQDLEANRDALIQGIRVTDIEGSDIDLIIGGEDL